ncbi:MAG: beta-lactamase family protein [Gemmatimonadota bacterium]|nr:beta-lactamase family protein [Gemmatimonadota bacterium]
MATTAGGPLSAQDAGRPGPPTDPQRVAVDAVFADVSGSDSPGCALGILQDGRPVLQKGYGMADLERGVPIGPATVFRTGSVSKQFTAAVIALLALDGTVDLDAPVRAYVPELPSYSPEVTVRQLVHHTSGVRDYLTLADLRGLRALDFYTPEESIELITRQAETNFPAGSQYLYSNSGYLLLTAIVERTTGKSLREVARERLFEPLGMGHTLFLDDHTEVVPRRAMGYSPHEGGAFRIDMTTLDHVGDGGVHTSIEDLARWEANFVDPTVGGEAFLETILTRGVLTGGDTIPYAMGVGHGTDRGLATVEHGGSFVGFRAHTLRFPDTGTAVHVLCNRSDGAPGRRAHAVAGVLLGSFMDPVTAETEARPDDDEGERNAARADIPDFASVVGSYYGEELDVTYHVTLDPGGVAVRAGPTRWTLSPVPGVDAVASDAGIRLRFVRDASGAVTGFLVDAGRVQNLRFVRTEPIH